MPARTVADSPTAGVVGAEVHQADRAPLAQAIATHQVAAMSLAMGEAQVQPTPTAQASGVDGNQDPAMAFLNMLNCSIVENRRAADAAAAGVTPLQVAVPDIPHALGSTSDSVAEACHGRPTAVGAETPVVRITVTQNRVSETEGGGVSAAC